ncbi:unnamed protein product [Penicillium olsonii]|nr:unnamed protein product [Penicillium olsonii]
MASSVHSTVSGNTAKPFSTQINVISSGTKKSINENIKEAIVARLGSSSRKKIPYEGTCEWLGKIRQFQSWVRDEPGSRGLLWVCGGPGKGKTHLATHFVTRLRTGSVMTELGGALLTSALGNDCIVLSYFCDSSNVVHSTELAVVLGLLNQLLELKDSEEFYQIISPKFSGRGQDLFSGPFIQDLWDCLEQIIRVIVPKRQIYIVLDGLDECDRPSQARLSSQMRSICHEGRQDEKNPVRVVIFSRPLGPSLPPMDPTIDLNVVENRQGTNADISIFVEKNCRLQRDKDRFCKLLTDRSEGTFLWVALAISLLDETSVQQKIVDEDPAFLDKLLPVGLPGMYDRILFNIADSLHGKTHYQDMMKIFRCLTVSQRPLTREEIGILTEMNEYIVNEALSAFGHILSTTGGVSDEEAIELIHLSLRQYLFLGSSRLILERLCWSVWPFLSSASFLLRRGLSQSWALDYVVFATVCFHCQGLLRRHSTLGFGVLSLMIFQLVFQRHRSSFLIDLSGRTLGRLMTKLLMVMFCVKQEETHSYLFERCIAVMSDEKKGLKRHIHDAESPAHLQNQLEIRNRWRRVQYPSRHWVAHLKEIEAKSSAIDKLETFLKQHFLHWLEAMAHLGVVSGALGDLDIIRDIARVR